MPRSVKSTLDEIRHGNITAAELPQITLMKLEQGSGYVSLNNRRLWVLKQCKSKLQPCVTINHSFLKSINHSFLEFNLRID